MNIHETTSEYLKCLKCDNTFSTHEFMKDENQCALEKGNSGLGVDQDLLKNTLPLLGSMPHNTPLAIFEYCSVPIAVICCLFLPFPNVYIYWHYHVPVLPLSIGYVVAYNLSS